MSTTSLYYVAEGFHEQYNAGIVRKDQENMLRSTGFQPLHFRYTEKQTAVYKIIRIITCFKMAICLPAGSLVVFHFPFQATVYKLLLSLINRRNIKTAVLIIDIDGIRDKNENELKLEIKQLQKFNCIVAHNEAMKELLQQLIPAANITSINVFDYPHEGSMVKRKLSNTVCFAGNISKSTFTAHLSKIADIQFSIYGLGYDAVLMKQPNVSYKGAVNPEILPSIPEDSFGLVWDGDSIENCDDYLRYNNPHKFSLYLAASLPVIVWKESALGAFVQEKNIGICVGSLAEIPGKIDQLSPEKYEQMLQQVSILGKDVRKGRFFEKIIEKLKML